MPRYIGHADAPHEAGRIVDQHVESRLGLASERRTQRQRNVALGPQLSTDLCDAQTAAAYESAAATEDRPAINGVVFTPTKRDRPFQ